MAQEESPCRHFFYTFVGDLRAKFSIMKQKKEKKAYVMSFGEEVGNSVSHGTTFLQ